MKRRAHPTLFGCRMAEVTFREQRFVNMVTKYFSIHFEKLNYFEEIMQKYVFLVHHCLFERIFASKQGGIRTERRTENGGEERMIFMRGEGHR